MISANACTAAVGSPFTAKGATTSMVVAWGFASNPNSVVGYGAIGGLVINAFPTTNAINVYVCNPTAHPITPGAIKVNLRVLE